jgi:FkbM family methyltransferase
MKAMKSLSQALQMILIRLHRRYEPFVTNYPGFPCSVIDKSSFLSAYHEIFEREIYKFETSNPKPRIVDCGANIGLSVLYFKKLYPDATITAFEPDPRALAALRANVLAIKASDVTIVPQAVAKSDGTLQFFSEGADGGRVSTEHDTKSIISIATERLSPHLAHTVDFLKIDIEGAELEVLEETQGSLGNVRAIFVEYHSLASKPQELDKILSILSGAGFRYYVEHTGVKSRNAFIKRETHLNYDLQLNIFGYRG